MHLSLIYMSVRLEWTDCHTFVSYFIFYFFVFLGGQISTISCVWPSALKLGCITNVDTLFLVMGFISLVEIQFMLISSFHFASRL